MATYTSAVIMIIDIHAFDFKNRKKDINMSYSSQLINLLYFCRGYKAFQI